MKSVDLGWVEVCLTVIMIGSCSSCNSIGDIRDKYVGDEVGVVDKVENIINTISGDSTEVNK